MSVLEQPLDMIKFSLDEVVYVKLKGERELRGRLYVFFVAEIGEVEETRRVLETREEETLESPKQLQWTTEVRRRGMLFVRGDAIILVAPPVKRK